MLHIINQSPFNSSALQNCIRVAQAKDVILLIEDAVFAAIDFPAQKNELTIYALESDIQARGLSEKISPSIQLIDYSGFVDLTIQHTPIQTWS